MYYVRILLYRHGNNGHYIVVLTNFSQTTNPVRNPYVCDSIRFLTDFCTNLECIIREKDSIRPPVELRRDYVAFKYLSVNFPHGFQIWLEGNVVFVFDA